MCLTLSMLSIVGVAAEIEHAELIVHTNGYHYLIQAKINAPIAAVRAVVTDFDRLARINDDIVSSHVLERYDAKTFKRRLLLKHCLLMFCFDLDFVERVEFLPNGDITTHIVVGEGNFRRGETVWRLLAIDTAQTQMTMEADQEPDFWIPPIIGPLIMKLSFDDEVVETAVKIERLANANVQ